MKGFDKKNHSFYTVTALFKIFTDILSVFNNKHCDCSLTVGCIKLYSFDQPSIVSSKASLLSFAKFKPNLSQYKFFSIIIR